MILLLVGGRRRREDRFEGGKPRTRKIKSRGWMFSDVGVCLRGCRCVRARLMEEREGREEVRGRGGRGGRGEEGGQS